MTHLDWLIVAGIVAIMFVVGRKSSRHMKGVSDFLAGNRLAGRYMLSIGDHSAGTGLIMIIAAFEAVSVAGFTAAWWSIMYLPIGIVLALTGFVYYRYRETRCLTLAQFFEKRYSPNFRRFAGIICFLTGIINFGVFPACSARFYVHFGGLPETFALPGLPFEISTFAAVMALDLAIAVAMVLYGGQISIMVTDCIGGIIALLAFVSITGLLMLSISWSDIQAAVQTLPADRSMINPLKGGGIKDFNVWFYLIGLVNIIFTIAAWQGSQAFNACARSPHEQKMGKIIGGLRWGAVSWATLVMSVTAFTVLTLPRYDGIASVVQAQLAAIENQSIQGQLKVPLVLSQLLPWGLKGLLFATMVFFSVSTHNTYMHSWGSIFIQDVYLPLTGKTLPPQQHVRMLKWAVVGVALYAFTFGLFHSPDTPVMMYWAITGTIFLPGAGAAVIGGLYWRRGTTAAAYPAICVGIVIGLFGLIYPPIYRRQFGVDFPINNQYLYIIAIGLASTVYIVVSLLTSRGKSFNLTKMLHRGEWAIRGEHEILEKARPSLWESIFGITREFSRMDRFIAIFVVCWNLAWFAWFISIMVLNIFHPVGDAWWGRFWQYYIWINLGLNVVVTIWFTWGGIHDIRGLFRLLLTAKRDASDDGRVVHEKDDVLPPGSPAPHVPKASESGRA